MIVLYFLKLNMFYNHCVYYFNHDIVFPLIYLPFLSPTTIASPPTNLSPASKFLTSNCIKYNVSGLQTIAEITLLSKSRRNIGIIYSTFNMIPSLAVHYSTYTYQPVFHQRFLTFFLTIYPT